MNMEAIEEQLARLADLLPAKMSVVCKQVSWGQSS
jgi:hypothetical protein